MTITSIAGDGTFDALARYLDRGLAVLPLYGTKDGQCLCPKGPTCDKSRGKHPLSRLVPNGKNNASRDKAIVRQWVRSAATANWGVLTGEPLVGGGFLLVLDVDPRNGGSIDSLPPLPETPRQETGGGGAHYWFRTPKPMASSSLGPGLDIQGVGKYVVVEPSNHELGGEYVWAIGAGLEDVAIADAPAWLIDALSEGAGRPPREGDGSARDTVLGEAFAIAGKLGVAFPDGTIAVHCPWADEHSDRRGRGEDTSTVILPPAGGSNFGGFKCMHGHCSNRKWHDVIKALPSEAVATAQRKYPMKPVAVPAGDGTISETPAIAEGDPLKDVKMRLAYKKTGDGIKNDVVNLVTILTYDPRWRGLLHWDEFSRLLRMSRTPDWHPDDKPKDNELVWSDEATNCLDAWIRRYWGMELKTEAIRQAVYMVGRRDSVNPLVEWLDSLKWDGVKRIESWTSIYLGSEDREYERIVGKKWLLSAVARAYKPGCKADHVLILEGPQGYGKSTALATLAGRDWFSDTPLEIGSKDSYVALRGRWVIELAELAGMSKTESDRLKAFFSSPTDSYRPPYGRELVSVPRTCVFAGTVNPAEYLHDDTGNRRYWPVKVGIIDVEGLAADRDQIWAEAVHVFKDWAMRGAPLSECLWWPSLQDRAILEPEQESRVLDDIWHEQIAQWLQSEQARKLLERYGHITTGMIIEQGLRLKVSDSGRPEQTRVGVVMRKLKWKKNRAGRDRIYVFTPPSQAEE